MNFTINGDNLQISIDDELSIYSVAELQRSVLEHWTDELNLELDLSAVSEVDSAGLQWLMHLKREARLSKRNVRFHSHSQPIIDGLELFNLIGLFGDPVVLPAS